MSLYKLCDELVKLQPIFWGREADTELKKRGLQCNNPDESLAWRYTCALVKHKKDTKEGFRLLLEVLSNELQRQWLLEHIKNPLAAGQLWECLEGGNRVRIPGEVFTEDYYKYTKLLVCLTHKLSLRDFDQHLNQSSTETQADHTSAQPISKTGDLTKEDIPVDDRELTILAELAEGGDKTFSQVEIEAATSIKRGTIKDKLLRLESIGLIHRPLGERKGYKITDKGREIAQRNQ